MQLMGVIDGYEPGTEAICSGGGFRARDQRVDHQRLVVAARPGGGGATAARASDDGAGPLASVS